jgi:hypothetical protein
MLVVGNHFCPLKVNIIGCCYQCQLVSLSALTALLFFCFHFACFSS